VKPVVLAIALLFAANLGKYRAWAESPQGYFMTKAERAEWSKLTTEAGAEQFVNDFVASRGPRFADEVAAAAKEADDHLTVAGRKGSKTLRGKLVIVLGPPSSFSIERRGGDKSGTMATHIDTAHPQFLHAPGAAWSVSEMRKRFPDDYKFTYGDRTIVVAVSPATGEDRILDARMAREAEELLEAAAKARRVTR